MAYLRANPAPPSATGPRGDAVQDRGPSWRASRRRLLLAPATPGRANTTGLTASDAGKVLDLKWTTSNIKDLDTSDRLHPLQDDALPNHVAATLYMPALQQSCTSEHLTVDGQCAIKSSDYQGRCIADV